MPSDLATEVLRDAFGRVREEVSGVLSGLAPDEVLWRPDPEGNSIGWLVWHLTRIQDDHLAGVGQVDQVWTVAGWYERFGRPYQRQDHGYGHSASDVGRFAASDPALLEGYHTAVHALTLEVLDGMAATDYARIVDRRWDPPVTAAVRLVSVVSDTLQHVGQAAYVRGLLERSTGGA